MATFAMLVTDPMLAVLATGTSNQPTQSLNFNATPTLLGGGPSTGFNGNAVSVLENIVSGNSGHAPIVPEPTSAV